MSEQVEAQIVTQDPTPAPEFEPEPAQIEEEPASPEPEPEPEPKQEQPLLPEVEAAIFHDPADGKYLVSITTRHPDPTKVAVNGRLVWEGVG